MLAQIDGAFSVETHFYDIKKARDSEFNVNTGLIVFVFLIEVIATLNQMCVILLLRLCADNLPKFLFFQENSDRSQEEGDSWHGSSVGNLLQQPL